jgi:hypothetical protein
VSDISRKKLPTATFALRCHFAICIHHSPQQLPDIRVHPVLGFFLGSSSTSTTNHFLLDSTLQEVCRLNVLVVQVLCHICNESSSLSALLPSSHSFERCGFGGSVPPGVHAPAQGVPLIHADPIYTVIPAPLGVTLWTIVVACDVVTTVLDAVGVVWLKSSIYSEWPSPTSAGLRRSWETKPYRRSIVWGPRPTGLLQRSIGAVRIAVSETSDHDASPGR